MLQQYNYIYRADPTYIEIAGAVNQSRTRHKSYTAMLLFAEVQFKSILNLCMASFELYC